MSFLQICLQALLAVIQPTVRNCR